MGFRLEHANICVRDIEPSARAESARLSGFERRTRVLLALNQPNRDDSRQVERLYNESMRLFGLGRVLAILLCFSFVEDGPRR